MKIFHSMKVEGLGYKTSMNKIKSCLIAALLAIPLSTFAVQTQTLQLQSGARMMVHSSILDAEKPTLILLPGIYRGYLPNEEILSVFTQKRLNWVSLHFSRHPESVIAGSQFFTGMVTAQELVSEVVQVKKALRIKKPVLISLSFSASLSPYWNKKEFPILIETAPMGRHDENNPPNANYQAWQQWMELFPIWGPWLVQSNEFWTYRAFWLQKVDELSKSHERYSLKRIQIAEGLSQLAWSSKGFDIRNQDFKNGPERFWILGQNEDRLRLQLQLEAIQLHKETGFRGTRAYVIPNAGHIVPVEQPEAYVETVKKILRRVRFQ